MSAWLRFGVQRWPIAAAVTAVCALLGPALVPPSAAAAAQAAQALPGPRAPAPCQEVRVPVALPPGGPEEPVAVPEPARFHVIGSLCGRPPLAGRTLQVLLAGATYDRRYWDLPLRPERYSYVRALTDAGYATLALDRIGTGASDHPPAGEVTVEADAFVVHQVVQALRAGHGPLAPFARVVLVGHSLGAGVALLEAAQYRDVDGLLLSGFLHAVGRRAGAEGAAFHPAEQDPGLRARELPAGYLTTRPGLRAAFYAAANAEADVIALDEATKDAVAAAALAAVPALVATPAPARAVQVPVLIAVGQEDAAFCSPPDCPEAGVEAGLFASAARPEVVVLPGTGHVLNLHRSAPRWFAIVRAWADRHVGPFGRPVAPRTLPRTGAAPLPLQAGRHP
jgi:pimeloyl-ACP methyl ester carboxylesterase